MNKKLQIIFTKGLQASGKSTWAKQFVKENQNYKRVCRDDFRHMIASYEFNDENEKIVTDIEKSSMRSLLSFGYNIIIDKMNLNDKYLKKDIQFIKDEASLYKFDLNIEIKEFPITLSEAIERDKQRDFKIGESVIKKTWHKYEIELKQMIEKAKPKYEFKKELPYCVICDIDGTLSDSSQRRIFNYKECVNDEIIKPVKCILDRMEYIKCILLVSGREEICRKETEEWLRINNIPYNYLYMRKEKDFRADTIVKKEIFDEHIKDKYNVDFVIDDRHSVCQMWIDQGLFVFNVNQDPYARNKF
jgi:predicted kinase